ncbi:MAG: ribonuclease G [Gammaproteobacteria bacterium]|nr:ribonuclease G [Gammaproteobacteria bacterium]
MSEEILINVSPQETRVAVVENGVLQELFIERANRHGLVGNIYQGKVSRVLPGMQAAFVEVGLERTAFLHVGDIVGRSSEELYALAHDSDESSDVSQRHNAVVDANITQLLAEGQTVMVQVLKDPIGTKGARLTTQISLPSRYLVYMPGEAHLGVSSKIECEEERERLRAAVRANLKGDNDGGFIVRTAGEGASQEAIWADMMFLRRLWEKIAEAATKTPVPSLVHGDLPMVLRILRDLLSEDVGTVRVDSLEAFEQVKQFAEGFFPHMKDRVVHYAGERPIFDIYGVEDEILRALSRKVDLKSGGHLVFDQTEAMTTVDVNTGGYVGHRTLEETIFKTNLEAAQSIARQLRLRNLGGIIIVDFIDMQDEDHKRQVLRALEKYLQKDHARTQVYDFSPLGLVEMTRKRTRESLERVLCEPCSSCDGKGSVQTVETVCYEIFREISRSARQFEPREMLIIAAPSVVDLMLSEEAKALADLEASIGHPIRLQAEALYPPDQHDVVLI